MSVVKAIIAAGGSSTRMRGVDKLFAQLNGMPVIAHTIAAFESCGAISGIVVAMRSDMLEAGRSVVRSYGFGKVSGVCAGGKTRQQSVANALDQIGACDIIMVHDCARPCVSAETIMKGISLAESHGVAVAAAPVYDTIKKVDENGRVIETVPRGELRAAHTPQVFKAEILRKAHADPAPGATDDAYLAERLGYEVMVYEDSAENIKITTPQDLAIAEAILARMHG